MKKVLTIVIAFLYLAVSSGLVVEIHYCMGKKVGSTISVTEKETHFCDKCGMDSQSNGCCHNDLKFYKLQDSHKQVSAYYIINAPVAILPSYDTFNAAVATVTNHKTVLCNSPPNSGQPSLCVLNCVFRI